MGYFSRSTSNNNWQQEQATYTRKKISNKNNKTEKSNKITSRNSQEVGICVVKTYNELPSSFCEALSGYPG